MRVPVAVPVLPTSSGILLQRPRWRSTNVPSDGDNRLTQAPGNLSLTPFLEAFVDPYEVNPKLPPPGRRWSAAEIRLKSDEDLQKLWVVLLRERNMLYSVKMLHERRKTSMPHPDRLHKTRKSMAMIKRVLGERDRAAAAARQRGDLLSRKQRDAIARKSREVDGAASRGAEGGAVGLDAPPLPEPRA